MAEYIEREAVEKFIENGLNNPDKKKAFGHDAIEIMAEVHYMRAADVAPVRHGRWSSNGIAIVCSECGRAFGIVEMFAHYCPWCGSRMDKEANHEVS